MRFEDPNDLAGTSRRRNPPVLGPTLRVAVVLAVTNTRVGAGSKQRAHDIRMSLRSGELQRRHLRVPVTPAPVRVGSMDEKPVHGHRVAARREQVQQIGLDGAAVLAEEARHGLLVPLRPSRSGPLRGRQGAPPSPLGCAARRSAGAGDSRGNSSAWSAPRGRPPRCGELPRRCSARSRRRCGAERRDSPAAPRRRDARRRLRRPSTSPSR